MKLFLKRITLSLFIVLTSQYKGYSQNDIVKLEYKYYTSYFSTSEHIPRIVTYSLTENMLDCEAPVKRSNRFTSDPEHKDLTTLSKDYKDMGYDRGHNMSAGDNKCDEEGMKECFYYSNMTPQPHSFNAGVWEELEKEERKEAKEYSKIIVTIGSEGIAETIGIDKVVVPKFMWKVIYIPSLNLYQCYCFPDSDEATNMLSKYIVNINEIERLGHVHFINGTVEIDKK